MSIRRLPFGFSLSVSGDASIPEALVRSFVEEERFREPSLADGLDEVRNILDDFEVSGRLASGSLVVARIPPSPPTNEVPLLLMLSRRP